MLREKHYTGLTLNGAKLRISVCDRVENIVENGENAGYQHFLHFRQYFQNPSGFPTMFSGLKVGIAWERVNRVRP